jgi:acetolactate synthase I/II/III large subunit
MPNGAQALIGTLVGAGIRTCFTNPGTSEINFVAALDSAPEMRAILTLFEGVATGAADGYARMANVPGATLLHLGPGLGNGLANLHNARRAKVPLLNIVGDHATYHVAHDSPLQSDIETLARNVSTWVRTPQTPQDLVRDAVAAIATASGPPSQVTTLIVPADVSWREGAETAGPPEPADPPAAPAETVEAVASALRSGRRTAILLGGRTLRERGLIASARIAAATGASLFADRSAPRLERGAGLPAVERIAYWPELVSAQLDGFEHLILADAAAPVSWFAYPGKPSSLVPDGCQVHELSPPSSDVVRSLETLVGALDCAGAEIVRQASWVPPPPEGPLTAAKVCQAVGAILPEGAIISDEAITSAAALPASTAGAPRHDWLTLSGGAIGQGLPVAVGAATACPDRPVIALQADGSAMYTIQSLWTMARERLPVVVLITSNRRYGILQTELRRAGSAEFGPQARALTELDDPAFDWSALAAGYGVPAVRAATTRELEAALAEALAHTSGPFLIEMALA